MSFIPAISSSHLLANESYSTAIKGSYLLGFIVKTALCLFIYYLLCDTVNNKDPRASLYQSILVGVVPVFLYTYLLIGRLKWAFIMLGIYLLKCGLGVLHYFIFIDPEYFLYPTSIRLTAVNDFMSMFEQISLFVNSYWVENNNISFEDIAYIPHAELYGAIALIFDKIGLFYLSIVSINGVASIMMAAMIGYITKIRKGNYGIALILAGLYPLSLITSYFFRDMVGLLMVTFFLTCIILAKKKVWFWLAIASFFFYFQRTVYCLLPVLSYLFWMFFKNRGEKGDKNIILVLVVLVVLAISSTFASSLLEENEGYTSNLDNKFMYILFPIRYLMCIIGPFPWTNTFLSPEKTYYIQDYVFSAAMFYITLRLFPQLYKDYKARRPIDYMVVMALLIMITGIFNAHARLGYIGWGMCFFIPYLTSTIYKKEDFNLFHLKYLVYMILFNVVYVMMGAGGFSSIFK